MKDFKPKVQVTSGWLGTMPHPIRDRAWDRICDIQDEIVVMSSTPTQLFINVNEGYTAIQGLAVLVTGIYLAMNDLETLLQTPTAKMHLAKMHQQIDFVEMLDPSDIAPFLEKYIEDKTIFSIEKEMRFKFISQEYINKKRDLVISAKTRLEFIPLLSFTISPWEKAKRLNVCYDVLNKFDRAIRKMKLINFEIENSKKRVKNSLQIFQEISKIHGYITCGTEFLIVLKFVQEQSQKALETFDDFIDDYNFDDWVREVQAITPPAPEK